jgi:outer membrane lipoprotein-sorting protein
MKFSRRSRALRWSAPFAMAGVIGLIALVPNVSADVTPSLPPLTPEQLIAKVQQARVDALSGTLVLTSNLGLPNLGSLRRPAGTENGFNPLDLLSGTNQAKIWMDGPERFRVALLRFMAEYDVIRNGMDVWTWDSSGSQVQHKVLSPRGSHDPEAEAPESKGPSPESVKPQTPDQVAKSLLGHLDPSTAVSVATPATVAGHSVYELVLRPRASQSTFDHIAIAADSRSGLPLQVTLAAKGQKKPALQFGFTSIDFSRPGAANFAFKPPPGSTDVTNGQPAARQPRHPGIARAHGHMLKAPPAVAPAGSSTPPVKVGADWLSVYIFRNGQLPPQANDILSGATRVSGAFGSGRLLQTNLFNFLVLDDGRVAAGAVTPTALEAAVASAR